MTQHIFSRYGGTRFLLSLGSCAVNTLVLVSGHIDQGVYQVLILGTVGAYITGNTLQNAASFLTNSQQEKERQPWQPGS